MKTFKRISVEFTHELEGRRLPETLGFVQECNTGLAFGPGAFESHVAQALREIGVVQPEIIRINEHLDEPPLLLLL